MFPQRLDSPLAYDIAKAMMDGFNRHYRLFRTESARAKHRFEIADWHGQQRAQRERIEFYDLRVKEAVSRLEQEFKAGEHPMEVVSAGDRHAPRTDEQVARCQPRLGGRTSLLDAREQHRPRRRQGPAGL